MEKNELQDKLSALFRKAASISFSEYIFAILRVEGITCKEGWNELNESENIKARLSNRKEKYVSKVGKKNENLIDIIASYVEICSTLEPYHILANIIRVSKGSHYTFTPYERFLFLQPWIVFGKIISMVRENSDPGAKTSIVEETIDNLPATFSISDIERLCPSVSRDMIR